MRTLLLGLALALLAAPAPALSLSLANPTLQTFAFAADGAADRSAAAPFDSACRALGHLRAAAPPGNATTATAAALAALGAAGSARLGLAWRDGMLVRLPPGAGVIETLVCVEGACGSRPVCMCVCVCVYVCVNVMWRDETRTPVPRPPSACVLV